MDKLQSSRLLRLREIIGDPHSAPPSAPLIPVSRSTWWQGVRDGRFPPPVKLGKRITAWRSADILQLLERFNERTNTLTVHDKT
jgi:prophage regulatory protein